MTRALKPPSNLPSLVKTAFAKARSAGDLHYFPTQVTLLPVKSVPFQLRFSPALANKPKAPKPDPSAAQKQALDPFANPSPALYITDLGPRHYLVLNKFAIVPEHFILATKEFKEQTHVLEPADLEATLACIEAYGDAAAATTARFQDGGGVVEKEEDGLFAFFNSGEHSGASQPHRHIQLLPVGRMRDGLESGGAWTVLADRQDLAQAPFAVFSEPIAAGMSGAELHGVYVRLYRLACEAVGGQADGGVAAAEGPARISYNMAMTKSRIVICPRVEEGGVVYDGEGNGVGRIALNGTVLAGTALVKNEAEWTALRENPQCLERVLGGIGVRSRHEG